MHVSSELVPYIANGRIWFVAKLNFYIWKKKHEKSLNTEMSFDVEMVQPIRYLHYTRAKKFEDFGFDILCLKNWFG